MIEKIVYYFGVLLVDVVDLGWWFWFECWYGIVVFCFVEIILYEGVEGVGVDEDDVGLVFDWVFR